MKDLYIKKRERYDYDLKNKDDRADFIDSKLGFIFDLTPELIMGYSGGVRSSERKNDKIPKMIDAYTTYFLTSRDAGSTKVEYSFYVSQRDEVRRKRNREVNNIARSIDDNDDKNRGSDGKTNSERYQLKVAVDSMNECTEVDDSEVSADVLRYAISNGKICKNDYKKILSYSNELILQSRDEQLIGEIEQIIFNCAMNAKDDLDMDILKCYTKSMSLRDISDKLESSPATVLRRLDKMLSWV